MNRGLARRTVFESERLVERRLERAASDEDPLDERLGAATERVLAWMRRKAALADGTSIGLPVSDGNDVIEMATRACEHDGGWWIGPTGRPVDAWPQVQVALLRDFGSGNGSMGTRRKRLRWRARPLPDARHEWDNAAWDAAARDDAP